MKRLILILALVALCFIPRIASAQMTLMGVDRSSGVGFQGPGDVVSGAVAWWGLRAYNAAYASGHGKIANICTPADAVCADVNSDSGGNFNLAGTPSLTCNNSGSICTIKTLYDQAGTACNSTACDITNATIARRPTLIAPGAANGCTTTSNFCMQFTNADLENGSPFFPGGNAQPYTISLVYNDPATSGVETIFSMNFATTGVLPTNANLLNCYAGSSTSITVSDGSYHAVQCVFAGASSNINVDGTKNTTSAGTGVLGGGTTIFAIGQTQGFGGSPFTGFLNEFGIWTTGFTDPGQAQSMSTNQHTYWGF